MHRQPESFKNSFAYALGYYKGRSSKDFVNIKYLNMKHQHREFYETGYLAGLTDYCELSVINTRENTYKKI